LKNQIKSAKYMLDLSSKQQGIPWRPPGPCAQVGRHFPMEIRMKAVSTYSSPALLLHWSMAAIISVVWFIGIYCAHFRGNAERGGGALYVHKAIATTVLFLFVLRLIYRLTHRYPSLPAHVSGPAALAAKAMHVLLYGIAMSALPLSGWFWSSVAGHPSPVLGLFNLPPLAPKTPALYDTGMWIHRILAWSVGALILLHVLAALKHHFVDKDEILVRMMPGRKSRQFH
jgi:cytochrome b561